MKRFDYVKAQSLDEVFALLRQYGNRAALIAGGTDVMVNIKKKTAAPDVLISLRGIAGLDGIGYDGDLRIGALVTHRTIERSAVIRKEFSALADAVDVLGSVQVRNVGTVGGNICTAAPSADTATPLLVLGAHVVIKSIEAERVMPLEEFFRGPGETALQAGEAVTELIIPKPLPFTGSAYWKHRRRQAMDLPVLGVSVLLSLDRDNLSAPEKSGGSHDIYSIFQALEQDEPICREVRIALGVAAPTPIRAYKAEQLLRGRKINEKLIDQMAEAAAEEAQPRDSLRGEAWYRKEMVRVFVKRMAAACMERIAGQREMMP